MTVFYRMCGIPSTNPSPIFQDNKQRLNKLCLRSFVSNFKYIKPKVVFLMDFCTPEDFEMVEKECPFEKEIIRTDAGINETCLMQYDLALKTDSKTFFFLECDYIWRPNTAEQFVAAVDVLGLVSPYDHPNFYTAREYHSDTAKIVVVVNNGSQHHWRTTERNTMTFGCRRDVLEKHLDLFNEFGYLDNGQWLGMTKRGQNLWTPIPSMATHMVKDYLAPSVDWSELW